MISDKGIAFPELAREERPGCNGAIEFRVLDHARKVRTPWQAAGYASDHVAACAVNRTDRDRLTPRHTTDGEWIIVRSY